MGIFHVRLGQRTQRVQMWDWVCQELLLLWRVARDTVRPKTMVGSAGGVTSRWQRLPDTHGAEQRHSGSVIRAQVPGKNHLCWQVLQGPAGWGWAPGRGVSWGLVQSCSKMALGKTPNMRWGAWKIAWDVQSALARLLNKNHLFCWDNLSYLKHSERLYLSP